jgi:seryl-tRNA synthetase
MAQMVVTSLVGSVPWLQQNLLNTSNKPALKAMVVELLDSTTTLTRERDAAVNVVFEVATENIDLKRRLEEEVTRSIQVCRRVEQDAKDAKEKMEAEYEETLAEAMNELDAAREQLHRIRDSSVRLQQLSDIAARRAAEASSSSSSGGSSKGKK